MGARSIRPAMGCLHIAVYPNFAKASTPNVAGRGPAVLRLPEGLL